MLSDLQRSRPPIVRFWGTRGGIPVALTAREVRAKIIHALVTARGRSFDTPDAAARFVDDELGFAAAATYGGATSCVELDCGNDAFFICDMGTGLRELGLDALTRAHDGRRKKFNFFLSHLHHDHILGFPHFLPARHPNAEIVIHACHSDAETVLRQQQNKALFSGAFQALESIIRFVTLEPGCQTVVDGVQVTTIRQEHPNGSFGYRFTTEGGASMVYCTDCEHKIDDILHETDFATFFEGADLVICDTMYSLAKSNTTEEGSGHSSNVVAIDLCHQAGARRLALFHHDPQDDDQDILEMYEDSLRYEELTRVDMPLEVICAFDGLEVTL